MSILAQICEDKIDYVRRMEHLIPDIVLKERAKEQATPRGFLKALESRKHQNKISIIAELKKASPDKGILRNNYDVQKIARDCQNAGATCLAVSTDQPYFKGHDEDLEAVSAVTSVPILRRDFVMTPYQIFESRAIGSDCISIIVAALNNEMIKILFDLSTELGMDVIFEIHNGAELDRAMIFAPKLISVNVQSIETNGISPVLSHDLIKQIPSNVIRIAESDMAEPESVTFFINEGYDALLINDSLMQSNDIDDHLKKLLGI